MKWWHSYKQFIEKNIQGSAPETGSTLAFWKNKLFTNLIMYLLPVSLVALVPGVIMSIKSNIPLLAVFDTATAIGITLIALAKGIRLVIRKTIFIICLYILAFILLIYLGSFGPGMIYLLGITVFVSLIFSSKIAYTSIFINIFICILFGVGIHFKWFVSPLSQAYDVGSWIAVSSNLVFLSTVIVFSITVLFNGLERSLKKEEDLKNELKKKTQNLEETLDSMKAKNDELEQFAYIASHDLQEPLRTIAGFTNLLEAKKEGPLGKDGNQYVSFISKSAERMMTLISGLLEYSIIGKAHEPEKADCNEIIDHVMEDLYEVIKQKKALVHIDDMPVLTGYPAELHQLFQNLVSNALKFTQPDVIPEIFIKAKKEKKHWLFAVQDNGIGIEKRFSEKIFVIFQRLNPRSVYEGTGIGLAYCKKIVDLHGGKIWVESEPGKGSIFYFTIPHNLIRHGEKN